jgi:hypothetical protein
MMNAKDIKEQRFLLAGGWQPARNP